MKDKNRAKTILHKLIIYAYLPLCIALGIFTSLGNVYTLGRVSLVTWVDYIDLALLLLPFITVVIYFVSLVALMGKFKCAVRTILFSTTLRFLIMLPVMYGFLYTGNITRAFHYVFECIITMLIWLFYSRNGNVLIES